MTHLIQLFSFIFVFFVYFTTELLKNTLPKHAVALKCGYNMLYRNFTTNQLTNSLFIAQPTCIKLYRPRYIQQHLKSTSCDTGTDHISEVNNYNSSTYSPHTLLRKSHLYTPDEIGKSSHT